MNTCWTIEQVQLWRILDFKQLHITIYNHVLNYFYNRSVQNLFSTCTLFLFQILNIYQAFLQRGDTIDLMCFDVKCKEWHEASEDQGTKEHIEIASQRFLTVREAFMTKRSCSLGVNYWIHCFWKGLLLDLF